MDEEKTIDEIKEIEPVAFDEVVKEEPAKSPGLRGVGDLDPADMDMIHKHLDNFLAKIAGEAPIDDNVRDSTEYWLDRIAEITGGVSGITKITKIWENADISAVMSTTIVPIDISGYDFVIVQYEAFVGSPTYNICTIIPVGYKGILTWTSQYGVRSRDVYCDNTAQITFYNGASAEWSAITSGLSTDTSACVPTKVYGVKLT